MWSMSVCGRKDSLPCEMEHIITSPDPHKYVWVLAGLRFRLLSSLSISSDCPQTKKKHKTTKDERLGLGIGVWAWGLGSGEWQKLWFARVNCKILLTCSRLLFGPKLAIKNGL